MVRIEEAVTHLAPVVMLRDMIEPVQRDLLNIANSVQELTKSDLELKELHKALMVERAQQEEARHKLEIQRLQEELAEQRAEQAEAHKRRGFVAWITLRAHPVAQFIAVLVGVGATLAGAVYGLLAWLQAHYK